MPQSSPLQTIFLDRPLHPPTLVEFNKRALSPMNRIRERSVVVRTTLLLNLGDLRLFPPCHLRMTQPRRRAVRRCFLKLFGAKSSMRAIRFPRNRPSLWRVFAKPFGAGRMTLELII